MNKFLDEFDEYWEDEDLDLNDYELLVKNIISDILFEYRYNLSLIKEDKDYLRKYAYEKIGNKKINFYITQDRFYFLWIEDSKVKIINFYI